MSSKTKNTAKAKTVDYETEWKKNPMRKPYLEKVVLNIGVGEGGESLERAMEVLRQITGKEPVRRLSRTNVKEFNLRKGRPIACSVCIRRKEAEKLLKRLFIVNNNKIKRQSFDTFGNFGFGITEHIQIPGIEYFAEVGIWGLDVSGRIVRPGMRVKTRRIKRAKLPKKQYVSRDEAQYFLKMLGFKVVKELDLEFY